MKKLLFLAAPFFSSTLNLMENLGFTKETTPKETSKVKERKVLVVRGDHSHSSLSRKEVTALLERLKHENKLEAVVLERREEVPSLDMPELMLPKTKKMEKEAK